MWQAESELIVMYSIQVYSAHGEILYKAMAAETQNLCYCGVATDYSSVLSNNTYESNWKEKIMLPFVNYMVISIKFYVINIKFCDKIQALTSVNYPSSQD